MTKPRPRICLFGTGTRRAEYSRNIAVYESLRACDVEIVDCTAPVALSAATRNSALRGNPMTWFVVFFKLLSAWLLLISRWRRVRSADSIWVLYPAHLDILLAAMMRHRDQILYMDAFISLYDTVIVDRKLGKSNSFFGQLVRFCERIALDRAHVVVLDTPEHVAYLRSLYPKSRSDITWLPPGIDGSMWTCSRVKDPRPPLRAALWTTFIPLHGVDIVVDAAEICQARGLPIQFVLYGDGQEAASIDARLKSADLANLEWHRGWFGTLELRDAACAADVCLGIFGRSRKAASVIPYKVQQALCAGRPVVTARTPAAERILSDRGSAILCESGNAESLADSLEWCIDNSGRLNEIGRQGQEIFARELSLSAISARMKKIVVGTGS